MSTKFFFWNLKKNWWTEKKKTCGREREKSKNNFSGARICWKHLFSPQDNILCQFFHKNLFVPSYMFRNPYISYFNRALDFPPKYFEYFSKFIHNFFFLSATNWDLVFSVARSSFTSKFTNKIFFSNLKKKVLWTKIKQKFLKEAEKILKRNFRVKVLHFFQNLATNFFFQA